MSRLWLKGCPLCQGDLYEEAPVGLDESESQPLISCLQCGHILSGDQEYRLRKECARRPRVA